ncbi:ionotropic receptor 93a [Athalia rosae]|uniref:ionotropic receptor 93a n=1 Tax=Athalia rosae TaxID=37344 RepID=UPI0020335DCE|nr:ionotropic receptor 93a [Athalia rosae]
MPKTLFLLVIITAGVRSNDFPSLITANASMAIVVDDHMFMESASYKKALTEIFQVVSQTVQDNMRLGRIEAHLFTDSSLNLRRDYTILLSVARCSETWKLFRKAQKEDLIHVAVTDADCPRLPGHEGISVPLLNPGEELSQVLLDLRTKSALAWSKINILHDDTFGRDTISRVLIALSTELPDSGLTPATRSVYAIKKTKSDRARRQEILRILSDFPIERLGGCFLVIVTIEMVGVVMEVAKSLKMVHPGTQWLYLASDTTSQDQNVTALRDILDEGANIAILHNTTSTGGACNTGLTCYIRELTRALAVSLEGSLIKEIELWKHVTEEEFESIRFTKRERRREVLDNMKRELFESRIGSEESCDRCLSWTMTSAITWGESFSTDEKNAEDNSAGTGYFLGTGSWTPRPGAVLTDAIFPHVEHGFRGRTLPVVSYHNPPWQIIDKNRSGLAMFDGLIFDVLKQLGLRLNFTYSVHIASFESETNDFESARVRKAEPMSTTNRIPASVIDLVRLKKVLLAACAATISESRKTVLNFTRPVSIQTYSLLTSRPRHLSRALLFMSPYTKESWGCLAGAVLIMGPMLYLVHKWSPFYTNLTRSPGLRTPWDCMWYVYGALLQQGGMHLPRADSGRLIVGTWWLVAIVIVATYSGNLVAFLTFPRIDVSVTSIEDLLARENELSWTLPTGSYLVEFLESTDEPKFRRFLAGAERYNVTNETDSVRRVREGKHVLIDWRTSLRFLMRRELLASGRCDFSLSAEEFVQEPIAMIVAPGSPYLSIINMELKWMHQVGLIHKWTSERMPIRDKCWEGPGMNQETNNHKVNIEDMQGSFFVLFIGFIFALMILSCEFLWVKRKVVLERKLVRPFVT